MKKNVQYGNLLEWDEYIGKNPMEALPEIYSHAMDVSKKHGIGTGKVSKLKNGFP